MVRRQLVNTRTSGAVLTCIALVFTAHTAKAQQPVLGFEQPPVSQPAPPLSLISKSSRVPTYATAALAGRPGVPQDRDVFQSGSGTLAPLPMNVFDSRVSPADTTIEGVGTGLIPDSAVQGTEMVGLPDGASRGATSHCVHWAPSSIQHYPLYFEDAMLERHGQSRFGCLQPVASGAKFIATIPLLPYIATLERPMDCRYVLGHYRPGTCAPVLKDTLPWDARAAAVQTGAIAGFFWGAPL